MVIKTELRARLYPSYTLFKLLRVRTAKGRGVNPTLNGSDHFSGNACRVAPSERVVVISAVSYDISADDG